MCELIYYINIFSPTGNPETHVSRCWIMGHAFLESRRSGKMVVSLIGFGSSFIIPL